jgi:hypothetical protein
VAGPEIRSAQYGATIEMTTTAPANGVVVCVNCRRLARLPFAPVGLTTEAAAWYAPLMRHVVRSHVHHAPVLVAAMAERLALLGAPTDPAAAATYAQLRKLLEPNTVQTAAGQKVRSLGLRQLVEALPMDGPALHRIGTGLATWERLTGHAVLRERFNPGTVVSVLLQIPRVVPYIERMQRKGMTALAQMFYPTTLAMARKDPALRGLWHEAPAYWGGGSEALEVVR